METIPYHPLLEVSEKEMEVVRRNLNLDVNTIKKNLDALEEWGRKQNHLAEAFKYLDRNMLERLHILGRGSLEMTKTRIDKLLTTRGMIPELCLNRSVDEFKDIAESINFIMLPKLNPKDQSRIILTKIINLENFSLLAYMRYSFMISEYCRNFEYNMSERHILDLQNVKSVNAITKLNPILLKKAEVLCTAGYGIRISGIHILNAPSFVDKIVFIFKQGLKEKVANRLQVHSSYEDLQKEIPKEVLPEDYGGVLPSCSKLQEQWESILKTEEAQKLIGLCNRLVADESKRSAFKFNEEYLGMPGSFRQLTVD
ncbi:alpha-tocopherol transfer protein-like [Bicyclus anynana]|uniref:Alpha-tocopherol transfer protein-like n=1 Tax=Bicyclus anynana TaxID=110368 RepID=A0ABM3LIS5_BICAN|nr:alpha-tocopherol transfer protein-like [Bicyclus anynana]XP_052738973.1 alpha-tocopherol transfer protein-like [Bicyclus anynana]